MNLKNSTLISIILLLNSTMAIAHGTSTNKKTHTHSLEKKLIAKVIQAYGGDKLLLANSMTITDHNKSIAAGQGENPITPGIFRINEVLTIDFNKKRKSMLSWRVSRTSTDLEKFIFDGKEGRIYDILNKKYAKEDWLTYRSTGSGIVMRSDTMIARLLSDNAETAHYNGDISYLGALHHKLKVKINSITEYTLFIDKNSGLISKMAREHPSAGEIAYAFSNHRKTNGVAYANELNFTVGGDVRLMSVKRDISMNPMLAEAFTRPADHSNWGEVIESSTLKIHKISSKVYHVGKGRSFSLFVDAGDYFIASGGHQGLKEKLQAMQALVGADKPLKYMISTHHHNEHLPSIKEAAELGAKIVTVSEHLSSMKEALSHDTNEDDFVFVDGKASFGHGAVEVYDIATMHADHYLMVYVPAAKLVFAEDHFETQLKTAMPRVHKDMVVFSKAMAALAIDVEVLIDGHSPRQLSLTEFNAATDSYQSIVCPPSYAICEKG
jgi:glyoxylase-like metal-dependent hydrolase (beta-lactamase superfamily II)